MKLNLPERFFGRKKMHYRASLAGGADHFERSDGIAVTELHEMFLTITVDGQLQPFRQGVYHRHTHAVQTTGYFVGIAVEFPTCVQNSHDHFGGRTVLLPVYIGRAPPAIVAH